MSLYDVVADYSWSYSVEENSRPLKLNSKIEKQNEAEMPPK